MTVDVILAVLATWCAYSLRLETLHWPHGGEWWVYLLGPTLAIPIFTRFGLYRAIFRYTGLDTLYSTAKAVALYALIVIAIHSWNMWPTFLR